MSESGIICFEHCERKVFCFDLPETCPGGCAQALDQCDFTLHPFVLPSPFSSAGDYPCSLAIKPTEGDFLQTYRSGHNLHIALTDSHGRVYEFDEDGTHLDRLGAWNQCIVINLLSKEIHPTVATDPDWREYWDLCLQRVLQSGNWTAETYHEGNKNCFDFVLAFLKSLREKPFSNLAEDKVDFCQYVILPKTSLAGKYIRLHRNLRGTRDGMFIMKNGHNSIKNARSDCLAVKEDLSLLEVADQNRERP
eukprot:snap_masked-scaffold104_size368486-processed-gene-2.8 protein:Tk07551 transcript:snap_masked-scaffold104_size368486-processed-gene-2.8-mRNA-1 annotation:"conserved hypothetical protein"